MEAELQQETDEVNAAAESGNVNQTHVVLESHTSSSSEPGDFVSGRSGIQSQTAIANVSQMRKVKQREEMSDGDKPPSVDVPDFLQDLTHRSIRVR